VLKVILGKIRPTIQFADYQNRKNTTHFATLLTSVEYEITDILPVNYEVMYVSWRLRLEALVPSPITNVVIAAYTTALARLKLYEYLERLDRCVLYYDMDSCIFISTADSNENEPPTGNFLGDITDSPVGVTLT